MADERRRRKRGSPQARASLRQGLAGLSAAVRPQDPMPGSRTLAEILQVRLLLEPPMAEMAARRAGPADLAELRMLLLCQRREVATGGTGRDADSAFHACLARVAGNSLLLGLVEGLAGRLAHMEPQFLAPELAASWPEPDPDPVTKKLFNILD